MHTHMHIEQTSGGDVWLDQRFSTIAAACHSQSDSHTAATPDQLPHSEFRPDT